MTHYQKILAQLSLPTVMMGGILTAANAIRDDRAWIWLAVYATLVGLAISSLFICRDKNP